MKNTVLIIEDSRFLRSAFEKVITRNGFDVLLAADGEEGLKLAQDSMPSVIVLDWIMPKMQGADVLTQLKLNPQTAAIPVIVVSGVEKGEKMETGNASGVAAFLDKTTLNVTELAQHIARLCPLTPVVQ
jgi:response regulator RpfG family c-di-GMP phosphodiesterase